MRNIRCESICNLVWGTLMQRAVRNAVEYLNYICHTYEPGSIWCNITIKDGASGNFYLLNASFIRVMILFVEFIFFSLLHKWKEAWAHSPQSLLVHFLDQMSILMSRSWKPFWKTLANIQAWLGYYGIDIREKCLGANNKFNGGSAIMRLNRR